MIAEQRSMDDETLAEAFWAVARRLRHVTSETTSPLGITPGQARALTTLRRHGDMRLNELSEHLRIAPRSTTEVVDALEQSGLAGRTPDPDDRRAVRVALTTAGEERAEELRRARAQEAEAFFGRLSGHDRDSLVRILRELRFDAGSPPSR